MGIIQQVLLGAFVVVLVVAYRAQIASVARRLFVAGKTAAVAPESVTLRVVGDIVAITELRDKLEAENCPEGVEACTALLRVIVEHRMPDSRSVA